MKRKYLVVVPIVLILFGCQPLENSARDAIAVSQGFIQQAQINHHVQCVANPTLAFPCGVINQAVGAQNALIDATETYCSWPSRPTTPSTLPCAHNKSALPILTAALQNLSSLLPDLKKAAGK